MTVSPRRDVRLSVVYIHNMLYHRLTLRSAPGALKKRTSPSLLDSETPLCKSCRLRENGGTDGIASSSLASYVWGEKEAVLGDGRGKEGKKIPLDLLA